MKIKKLRGTFVALSLALIAAACGSKESDGGGGDGDGDSALGDGDVSTGDGDGDSLDQGSLSENCTGVSPTAGATCDESGLVCPDGEGHACVCGGLAVGEDDDEEDDFGRPGRPGDEDAPNGGVWECFGIGQAASGGAGGDTGDGSGGGEPTGGADGTGGGSLGGQGGDGAI